ncbi:phage holin, lambda family [Salmonella enterica]|uniref:phage holin, lambda family n=1 Tax=Salmonella enterica TaxID=28901 RepID=UPI00237F0874|nr:phage holin, lambda family [Salmonella enterica]
MNDKTPEFWAAVLTGLKNAWPQILGALMAGLIAYLRRMSSRNNPARVAIVMGLEGVLCGALSLCVTSALDVVGLPVSISPFVGGIIGFVGVDKLREIAISALKKRAGVNDENQ